MEDITFSRSMYIIIEALGEAIMESFHITEAQLEKFTFSFVHRLIYAGGIVTEGISRMKVFCGLMY